jgi:hypothetical protein
MILPEIFPKLLTHLLGAFHQVHFADLRHRLLQQLVSPQTEGIYPASVHRAAEEPQCDGSRIFIDRDHFNLTLGQLFQPGVQAADLLFNPLS